MNSELIYQDLLRQYNDLSDKEKIAIIIYKSSLYYHINAITKINDFENKSSEEIFMLLDDNDTFVQRFDNFKKTLMYSQNMVVRFSYFSDINFDNVLSFIDSMRDVYHIIDGAKDKIKLCDDLKVYRGISVKKGTSIEGVSISNLISTSIKVDDVNDFIYQNGMDESHLFTISLKKDTNVLVSPLTVVQDYEDGLSMIYGDTSHSTLKVVNRDLEGQTEIILFKDDLEFKELNVCELDIDEEVPLKVHELIVTKKEEILYKNK